jgi:hypothetical protein
VEEKTITMEERRLTSLIIACSLTVLLVSVENIILSGVFAFFAICHGVNYVRLSLKEK